MAQETELSVSIFEKLTKITILGNLKIIDSTQSDMVLVFKLLFFFKELFTVYIFIWIFSFAKAT